MIGWKDNLARWVGTGKAAALLLVPALAVLFLGSGALGVMRERDKGALIDGWAFALPSQEAAGHAPSSADVPASEGEAEVRLHNWEDTAKQAAPNPPAAPKKKKKKRWHYSNHRWYWW